MEFGDIITLASIGATIFVVWKLYTVLGQRTGHQAPPPNVSKHSHQGGQMAGETKGDNVVDMATGKSARNATQSREAYIEETIKEFAEPGTDLHDSLKSVMELDKTFNPNEFITGAKMAYEMIVTAFADGDDKALKNLLSKEVFAGFSDAIATRKAEGQRMEFSFVGVNECKLMNAETSSSEVLITLRFSSQIISATLDRDGELIDGDQSEIADVTDVWTFARDSRSRDPNWKLVATEADS